MRPSALLFAALFLALPLAGCLGASTATAGDLVADARSIAKAWDADAILQGAATAEIGDLPPIVRAALAEADEDSPEAALLQIRDDNVGDGRSAAWLFAFRAGDRQLLLAVDAGGRELMRHEDDERGRPAPALEEFAIDSAEAMRLAAEHNATFGAVRAKAVVASLALMPARSGPTWVLMLAAGFDDESDTAFAVVDATSGNVTSFDEFDPDLLDDTPEERPAPAVRTPYYTPRGNRTFIQTETGSERGSLSVAEPDAGSPFVVKQAGHSKLRLQLTLPRTAPPIQATATVTAPDGRTAALTFTAALLDSRPAVAEMDAPVAGEYKVAIHLDTGVLHQYDFQWCAPGSRMAAQDASSACGEA